MTSQSETVCKWRKFCGVSNEKVSNFLIRLSHTFVLFCQAPWRKKPLPDHLKTRNFEHNTKLSGGFLKNFANQSNEYEAIANFRK